MRNLVSLQSFVVMQPQHAITYGCRIVQNSGLPKMNDATDNNPKISGCLEKKGKMKMMGSYKKYWFVLEGRLLLYYRSKDEYEAISPCKGSINLCPPCNVRPCSSAIGVFQIQCRSNSITLVKGESQEDQNRWMNAIMSALNQPKNHAKLSHFRYSLNELADQKPLRGMLTCNHTAPTDECQYNQTLEPNLEIIHRLQKNGGTILLGKG
ncbi:hypothetical protein NQ317_018528 [Molorchus minor]|uniref:PH domain-containing protein n=1 Tax=Molorchus minor TaxID=1323400 RepID=A0ABQ9IW04_9CUCU|nr:hypothetical protein NQ317_018528 [Molorchus minor]